VADGGRLYAGQERLSSILPTSSTKPFVVTRVDPHFLRESNDPLLSPVIDAVDELERRRALEEIMTRHVQPTVRMVLARHRGPYRIRCDEADDIAAIVTLRLLRRLEAIVFDAAEAIANLVDYTAIVTYNAIYDVYRNRFPERTRLSNRIRYTLASDPRFATWETPAAMVCGLVERPASKRGRAVTGPGAPLADVIETLLREHGGPLALNDLLRSVAEIVGVSDAGAAPQREMTQEPVQLTKLEERQRLDHLWSEIRSLAPEHRVALLLNLREAGGGNAVVLFIGLGIATIDEVAEAVGLTVDRLAELWGRLPLDDLTIAEMLGVTRQQVINYRRAARNRLVRRTGAVSDRSGRP
jgi:hypothetical protein